MTSLDEAFRLVTDWIVLRPAQFRALDLARVDLELPEWAGDTRDRMLALEEVMKAHPDENPWNVGHDGDGSDGTYDVGWTTPDGVRVRITTPMTRKDA